MPNETFDITVTVRDCIEKEIAIARASSYLSYADQTDTVGYAPNFKSVFVHTDGTHPTHVTLTVELEIMNDQELKRFMDEMVQLAKVKSVEREVVA